MSSLRRNVIISGRVQGVCFRAWTADRAKALGLSGWVRNLMDGSVEALFEGETDAVETMLKDVWEGPSHAFVENITEKRETLPEELSGFQIRY